MNQAKLVAWLKSAAPWGSAPEVIETHAAYVFLTGEQAFKLKKAVNLGYLDFSTADKRRRALERELTLNRRTAPHIYRRVVPITQTNGKITIDGDGEPVDHLLEMKRFAKGALLSEVAEQGHLDAALIEKFARHVVSFHDHAEMIAGVDWPAAVRRIGDENARDLRSQAPATFDPAELDRYIARRDVAMAKHRVVFARQSTTVRLCHGDMHLANAFVDHGEPVLFDCIEFDDFYATIPPLYDLAFLLMDLCARNLTALANRALNAWLVAREPTQWIGALADLAALSLYLALRAEVRAKTEGRKPGARASAQRYLQLASTLLGEKPPRLIAIGGLSGTGKSTLARALAPGLGSAPGAIHLRTDEIRKRLAGVDMDARLPAASYTPEASAKVYAAIEDLAASTLRAGQTVIADAVFAAANERQAIEHIAAAHGAPFVGLWLEAPVPALESRLDRRAGDASDADSAVLRRQLDYDTGAITWHRLDTSAGVAATLEAARNLIDG